LPPIAVRSYAKELGKDTLLLKDINAGSKNKKCPSKNWILKVFAPETKSLPDALRAIGLDAKLRWTRESGAKAIKELAKKLKRRPKMRDIKQASKDKVCPSAAWFLSTFSPGNEILDVALNAIGL
jgi:hypothetical protein